MKLCIYPDDFPHGSFATGEAVGGLSHRLLAPMKTQLRVVLLIESSRAFGRGLLAGIAAYSMTHGPWTFYHEERSIDDPIPRGLRAWTPDGCIGRIWPTLEKQVRQLGVPSVNVLYENTLAGIPNMAPNDTLVAQAAVHHLLDRGLRQFAFCGFRGLRFSEQRKLAFREALGARGYPVSVFEDGGARRTVGLVAFEQKWLQQLGRMETWLRGLPKPVGLMACNDVRAYQVSNACREIGLAVPDEVAIIGVDNDPTLCELATPPLTSIDPNPAKVGYEAAALLHRMIENKSPAPKEVLIEPTGIVARRSSDVLAIPDRDVVDAVRFVRDRACQGLTVEELVEHTAVSRSTLDRWFTKCLGHSASDEITHVRIERAKELLATTNLVVEEVSRLAGFSHPETMYRLFKENCNQTPSEFRKARQLTARGRV
ncbi:MAG TPA: DNA-binding transcriptional regulator [Pirellulales bacterium]|nr:DNA-binding transcriptional regulator [Pirellulales bacterium]